MMELLSPAGDRDALVAAVRNGADAVYLGAQALNARRGAGNFDADALLWAAEYCHERGVRLHVTVNTLVKQAELPLLEEIAAQIARAGADAAIVQDLGAAAALRRMVPGLRIHASTQMAVHNRQGVRFCQGAGFDRVVLAREASEGEIAECCAVGPDIEVFAHGALCVACSGQCLFSSLVGGRSGNRGLCAQPCRLPYRMGGAEGYLLSPKDLCQLPRLQRLAALGVRSIKIEGRMKRPEYVAVVTRIYREMLDHPHEATGRELDALRQIYNRGGFTRGYGPGLVDGELMYPDRPNHCGLAVGRVEKDGRARLTDDVSDRDQLVVGDAPVRAAGARGDAVPVGGRFPEGASLVRLADDRQLRAARASYEGAEPPRVALRGRLTLRVGEPMRLWASDGANEADAVGAVAVRARQRGADAERIRAQIERTGGTIYAFEALDVDADADAFAPLSALNDLRRAALGALGARRIDAMRAVPASARPLERPAVGGDARGRREVGPRPAIRVQSADAAQLSRARAWGADALIFAPDDITPGGLDRAELPPGAILALPMTSTGASLDALHAWARRAPGLAGVLASNPAHLALDWPGTLDADFSMNAANALCVGALRAAGAALYVPSVELTAAEIEKLPGDRELIVHGRLPLMQLRHCPLNARRGGAPHAACRACDKGGGIDGERLTDRKGVPFPLRRLKAPDGCIVRVLNSVPLSMAKRLDALPAARAWRIVLTDEGDALARAVVAAYAAAARGEDARETEGWPLVEAMRSTTGHYFRGVE